MKFNSMIIATTIAAALPLAASAASLIIPAAGAGPGANGSLWKSEVTIANLSASPATLSLVFHDRNGIAATAPLAVPAHSTTSIDDIVATTFGKSSATGAIEISGDTSKLVVSSRTYNESSSGRFGQDIPAIDPAPIADATEAVLLGPSSATEQRFNFGVYAVSNATIEWQLVRADGTTAARVTQSYAAGQQIQYNGGINSLFGETAKDNDSVHATFTSGQALVYGSAVENASGDPSYVPGVIALPESTIDFLGVDDDENGSVDFTDANHDNVLDTPLDLTTSLFPNFFRIVAASAGGEKVHYELIGATDDVTLIDDNGTVEWAPGSNWKGASTTLKVRATAGSETTILSIPVKFR